MELAWLKYFYEVAKEQSVTRASVKMRVSQPAVSKMIKQLEGSLGYALFRKSGREIRLTADGEQLMQVCRPIFARLTRIKRLKTTVDFGSDEVIRMGASDNLCSYVLPKCLEKFREKFPLIQWNLYSGTSSEIKIKILSGELDSALFYTRLTAKEKESLDERVIGKVRFRVVYPPHHRKISSIASFNRAALPYIGARMIEYQQTNAENWIHHRLKLKVNHSIQVNSKEVQKRMVLQRLGYAILPEFMVTEELKKGTLLELKTPPEFADLLLITRKHEGLSMNVEYFMKNFFRL